jgi:hypothetical protein
VPISELSTVVGAKRLIDAYQKLHLIEFGDWGAMIKARGGAERFDWAEPCWCFLQDRD